MSDRITEDRATLIFLVNLAKHELGYIIILENIDLFSHNETGKHKKKTGCQRKEPNGRYLVKLYEIKILLINSFRYASKISKSKNKSSRLKIHKATLKTT